jgi:hypothetical protein
LSCPLRIFVMPPENLCHAPCESSQSVIGCCIEHRPFGEPTEGPMGKATIYLHNLSRCACWQCHPQCRTTRTPPPCIMCPHMPTDVLSKHNTYLHTTHIHAPDCRSWRRPRLTASRVRHSCERSGLQRHAHARRQQQQRQHAGHRPLVGAWGALWGGRGARGDGRCQGEHFSSDKGITRFMHIMSCEHTALMRPRTLSLYASAARQVQAHGGWGWGGVVALAL